MNHLSSALSKALEKAGRTQTDLADKSGIPFQQINRYINRRGGLTPRILSKILEQFSTDVQMELMEAYLKDKCPTKYGHLVDIRPGRGAKDESAALFARLPTKASKSLNYLAEHAHEPSVRKFFDKFSALVKTLPKGSATRSS